MAYTESPSGKAVTIGLQPKLPTDRDDQKDSKQEYMDINAASFYTAPVLTAMQLSVAPPEVTAVRRALSEEHIKKTVKRVPSEDKLKTVSRKKSKDIVTSASIHSERIIDDPQSIFSLGIIPTLPICDMPPEDNTPGICPMCMEVTTVSRFEPLEALQEKMSLQPIVEQTMVTRRGRGSKIMEVQTAPALLARLEPESFADRGLHLYNPRYRLLILLLCWFSVVFATIWATLTFFEPLLLEGYAPRMSKMRVTAFSEDVE